MKRLAAHFGLLIAGILVQEFTHSAVRAVKEHVHKRKGKDRRDKYFG